MGSYEGPQRAVKRRPYSSSARADKARRTRVTILIAATELFLERGYAATSVAAIAVRAGVTPRTVFLNFASKRALLQEAIGAALVGDDGPESVRERDWFSQTVGAAGADSPALFARFTTALHERSAALLEVAEAAAAADPEVAYQRDQGRRNRRADLRRVAEAMAIKSSPDIDVETITDLLYTLGSSAVYAQVVFQCGWTPQRFERWLAATLTAALTR